MVCGADVAAVDVQTAAAAAAAVAPLLALAGGALQQLAVQAMPLHRATAKLSYVTAALFAGVVREGFCMPVATSEGAHSPPALSTAPPLHVHSSVHLRMMFIYLIG